MGILFSRFRRKKSTDEVLEEIQNDIKELEENRDQTLQRQKYWVGRLYIYSIIAYVLIAAVFYFWFFPVSLADRIFYIIPLLGFPLIVILLKKFITWYFKREILNGKEKLSDLKAKKKKILEDVMNKETYKVAKEILEKYAPEQIEKNTDIFSKQQARSRAGSAAAPRAPGGGGGGPQGAAGPGPVPKGAPPAIMGPPGGVLMQTPYKTQGPMVLQRQPSPQRRLVRPIIPRERNFIDRIIESIVGDGPSNRYALICRNCSSHNGMALKEEFEYLAFRCAYCGFPNPAHKVRPRPSVHRDREQSEDRKSAVSEGKVEGTDEERSTDEGETQKDTDSPPEESGREEVKKPDEEGGGTGGEVLETAEPQPPGSEDSAAAPPDGVRPRKPLLGNND